MNTNSCLFPVQKHFQTNKTVLTLVFSIVFIVTGQHSFPQFITSHEALFMPELQQPQLGQTVTDPVFGTEIKRITSAYATGNLGIVPQYSKRQAWNADESYLLLLNGDDGYFSLYDGQNYQFIKPLLDPVVGGEDVFWHPDDKDIIIFCPDSILYSYNVTTNLLDTLHVFTDYTFLNTKGEGNLSVNGRYYAAAGQHYDYGTGETTIKDILVYDLAEDEIVSIMPFPQTPGIAGDVDWMSVSPLGNYVVVDYSDTETGQYHGLSVYDLDLNFLWQLPVGAGHSDLGTDQNGDEVVIKDYYDETVDSTRINKYRLSDGTVTTLLTIPMDFDLHESCRNLNTTGWCFVSTFDYVGRLTDNSSNWLPFEDEVFALKMDGSGEVQRIAHHHSRRFSPSTPDPDNSVYWAEPHATVNRAGTKVIWGSNWRLNMAEVSAVDTYVCDFSDWIGLDEEPCPGKEWLDIYPVPAREKLMIHAGFQNPVPAEIELLDFSGRKIRDLYQGIIGGDTEKLELKISDLPPGIYMVKLITARVAETSRLIIVP